MGFAMYKIKIIVPTFNSSQVIRNCLQSLPQELLECVRIIDNVSSDSTVESVQRDFPAVSTQSLSKNIGFGGALNYAIERIVKDPSDYVLIANPDVVFRKETLEQLVKVANSNDNKVICGPKILTAHGRIWSTGGFIDQKRFTAGLLDYGKPDYTVMTKACDFISGTCMLIPISLLLQELRFDPDYFLYYEDVEFCYRAGVLGYRSICVGSAEILHQETSEKPEFKKTKNYYLARNHLLFVEKNAPFLVKLRERLRLPKSIGEHINRRNIGALKGISHYFLRKFGSYAERK